MPKLVWDAPGTHLYETGVDQGVLYRLNASNEYAEAEVWNGLTGVTESPSGAEESKLWADNINYASLRSAEEFGGTIEAYTYPDSFAECDGTAEVADGVFIRQQPRAVFGLSYRTIVGNEIALNDFGYKIHLIWGATCSPSEKAYSTVNDSPEAITLSWEFTTNPVPVTGHKPTSSMVIDVWKLDDTKRKKLEDALYGTDPTGGSGEGTEGHLPTPDQVIALIS